MVEDVERELRDWEARGAEGRLRRVGMVNAEREYERPFEFALSVKIFLAQWREVVGWEWLKGRLLTVSKPTDIEPTNFSVDTVFPAIAAICSSLSGRWISI